MFQEHQYDGLRAVQKVVNEYTPCAEEKINKVFARLIMFYHPDRLSQSMGLLEKAYSEGDFEQLFSMSHILHVKNLEPGQFTSRSFLTALKRRVYGNLNVDFPMYLLEDLEEIEMSDYELESLEGIESCRYVRVVDLTNNNLTDLTELGHLHQVERLYLANNHLGLVDALSNMVVLQVLDISFNDVDDLSPLFDLNHLNYLNVMGNRIPSWQMEKLQENGVTVVH